MNTITFRTPVDSRADFADWLSPILVKELRQGLKTRMFVSVFILLQAVMIIIVGLQLLAMARGAGRSQVEGYDWLFWAVIWLPLLMVMPARGLVAVSSELNANTLDSVQLTKLTAFRIVLGKWVALVAQTLLLVAAVLPYTVLRYFFGKVDVVMDLTILYGLVQGSLTLTAVAVMLSSMHLVVRIVVVLQGIPLAIMLMSGLNMMIMFGGGRGGAMGPASLGPWMWVSGIVTSAVMVYFLLEMAAGRIAPAAENHSGRRRAVALGLALLMPLMIGLSRDLTMELILWLYSLFPLWGWAVLEALCERTVLVPSLYRPFAAKGFLGRLAGRVFYPGWASGLVFVSLMMLIALGSMVVGTWVNDGFDHLMRDVEKWRVGVPLLVTAVVLPVLVLRMFPRVKQPVWLYLLVQALFVLVYLVATIVAESPGASRVDKDEVYAWLAPFPLSAFLAWMGRSGSEALRSSYEVVGLPVCGLVLLGLTWLMWKEFRVIRALERESLAGMSEGTKS
jgi:hypothetical protein